MPFNSHDDDGESLIAQPVRELKYDDEGNILTDGDFSFTCLDDDDVRAHCNIAQALGFNIDSSELLIVDSSTFRFSPTSLMIYVWINNSNFDSILSHDCVDEAASLIII